MADNGAPKKSSSSSSTWAAKISTISYLLFFFLIFLQIPLFRVPCRRGVCRTPIEITCSQLIATNVFPVPVVKALLYPGALVHSLISTKNIPKWSYILQIYNLTDSNSYSDLVDLQRLEVLAGSYFCVAGALVGLLKPGRMNMFGTLLIVWGLIKETFLKKPAKVDPTNAVYMYRTMILALVLAFSAIKYDTSKLTKPQVRTGPTAKPLKSSTKSKLK